MAPVTLKDVAEALRLGVQLGLVSVMDAVRWADARLLAMADPDPAIIDVSLSAAKGIGAACDALGALPGEPTPPVVFRLMIALIDDQYLSSITNAKSVTTLLWQMSLNGYAPSESTQYALCSFDDSWDLADQGIWSTVAEVHESLLQFLAPYRYSGLRESILNGTVWEISTEVPT